MKPRRVVLPVFEDRDLDQQTKRRERRALHRLSLALLHVNRSLLVHNDCCSIRRVSTRGDRNQNAPTAHRFPVSAGIILQQRCYFQISASVPPSKSTRLTSLTSSRENPDSRRCATTLSAVAESLEQTDRRFCHNSSPVRAHCLERVFFDCLLRLYKKPNQNNVKKWVTSAYFRARHRVSVEPLLYFGVDRNLFPFIASLRSCLDSATAIADLLASRTTVGALAR